MKTDIPSVMVTVRLSARERVLLDKLVALASAELGERGANVTLSTVVRGLILKAARSRKIEVEDKSAALSKLGPTIHHRQSFAPVRLWGLDAAHDDVGPDLLSL